MKNTKQVWGAEPNNPNWVHLWTNRQAGGRPKKDSRLEQVRLAQKFSETFWWISWDQNWTRDWGEVFLQLNEDFKPQVSYMRTKHRGNSRSLNRIHLVGGQVNMVDHWVQFRSPNNPASLRPSVLTINVTADLFGSDLSSCEQQEPWWWVWVSGSQSQEWGGAGPDSVLWWSWLCEVHRFTSWPSLTSSLISSRTLELEKSLIGWVSYLPSSFQWFCLKVVIKMCFSAEDTKH